jgi:pSer/pThr/pTyr-binding forkhead associated (FHA) protein
MGGEREYVRVRRWPFSIGRNPANDLCLVNSSHISRHHARILKDQDSYLLVATGRNPTFLNGALVRPQQPVEIEPGDCIELPDYLIEVRDTSRSAAVNATVNVEVVSNSVIIVRRVASVIGTSSWTVEAIQTWLSSHRGREIWIRHHQVTLCLPGSIDVEQLDQRLRLFDTLIAHLDPQALNIELVDPGVAAIRAE